MVNNIVRIKRSHTVGKVPAALADGELAVNLADRQLYAGDGIRVFPIGVLPPPIIIQPATHYRGTVAGGVLTTVVANGCTVSRATPGGFEITGTFAPEETIAIEHRLNNNTKEMCVGFVISRTPIHIYIEFRDVWKIDRDPVDPPEVAFQIMRP